MMRTMRASARWLMLVLAIGYQFVENHVIQPIVMRKSVDVSPFIVLVSVLVGASLLGVVGAMAAFYHDSLDINDQHQREVASIRLIAKMPTIAAMAYKYSIGQPFVYPDNSLSYTGNFLKMTFGVPAEEYEVIPAVERAMDRIFILHADHEQNASTSTVRLAGSSGANPFA